MFFLIFCGEYFVVPEAKVTSVREKKCFAKLSKGWNEADVLEQGDDETALKVKCEELNKNLENSTTEDLAINLIKTESTLKDNSTTQGSSVCYEINSSATTEDSIDSETKKNVDSFTDDSIIDPTYDPDTDDVSDNETEFQVEEFDWKDLDTSLENLRNKQNACPFGKIRRIRWTAEEKNELSSIFGDLKNISKLPSLSECSKIIQGSRCLKDRTPAQMKSWLDNQRKADGRKSK